MRINQTTQNLFQHVLDNGEVRYTDMIRFIVESNWGVKYNPTAHRGQWVGGIRYHVGVGNLSVRYDGNKSFYSLTKKGMGYLPLDQPTVDKVSNNCKLVSQLTKESEGLHKTIGDLKVEVSSCKDFADLKRLVVSLDWYVNRVSKVDRELRSISRCPTCGK